MDNIKDFLETNGIQYERDTKLSKHTWIKTGGNVGYWITPTTTEQLFHLIGFLRKNEMNYDIVGHTSNIYYLNSCSRDIIVSTLLLKNYLDREDFIECDCGVPVAQLSRYAIEKGYKGYAGLVNLPGTMGGGIINNSSCFKCAVSDLLIDADFYDYSENIIRVLTRDDFGYTKRNSLIKSGALKGVILKIRLKKTQGNKEEEIQLALEASHIRKTTQEPPAMTLGSIYAELNKRKGFKTTTISRLCNIMRRLSVYSTKRYVNLTLLLFNCIDLSENISKKNINTFIWKNNDEDIHTKFMRYQKMMNQIFDNPRMEIEVRQ